MFDHLLESRPRPGRRSGSLRTGVGSTLLHAAVIAAGVWVTAKPPESPVRTYVPWDLAFPTPPADAPVPRRPEVAAPGLGTPLSRLPELPAVPAVPDGIPPVASDPAFDPREWDRRRAPRGPIGTTGPPAPSGSVFDVTAVDDPPIRVSCPRVDYPQPLRHAHIEGRVVLQFVVEPDGRVEPASVRVLKTDHRAFDGPARDMAARCRFRPGRVGGTPVRVLVRLPVLFALQR